MRFIDELIACNDVSPERKQSLKTSTVIVADNVSSYFYEGTDKEYWFPYDFPNVAPPFENFFLDFVAPSQCVSKVTGVHQWSKEMPTKWGMHCLGRPIVNEHAPLLLSEDGRRKLLGKLKDSVIESQKALYKFIPDFKFKLDTMSVNEVLSLSDKVDTNLIHTAALFTKAYNDALVGKWDLMEEILNADVGKWELDFALSYKMEVEGDTYIEPYRLYWRMIVDETGKISTKKDGGYLIYTALGQQCEDIVRRIMSIQDSTFKQAFKAYEDSLQPFRDCALLTISFLHCKNVLLTDVQPPIKRVHNKAAKRRGEKDIIPMRYKVLDIKPMRQVLKNEGSEDTQGTSKALHICRGHFKHYENGRGLFGKYKGTYWFPEQTRGTLKQGLVDKDYRIKLD
jgi:hypothetical protein